MSLDVHAQDDHAPLHAMSSLLDLSHFATHDEMVGVIRTAAAELGWRVTVYLVDYGQRQLVPLPGQDPGATGSLAVDGTLAGRAFRSVTTVVANGGEQQVWTPLIDGAERLGVLDVLVPQGTDVHADDFRDVLRWYAHMVGHLLAGKSPYSDVEDAVRASKQRTVASELVWSLLPPLTMACHDLVISGCLEPAHAVAGDFFDYAVDSNTAQVGIMDATGHDLKSGLVGAMTLAAYRNGRRQGRGLEDVMALVDETLRSYEVDTYATGIFGRLDMRSGAFTYLNAGHPAPLLIRGGKVVKSLDEGRRILFGATPAKPVSTAEEQLERGDWLVLYTDGVVEARDSSRAFFGLDRFVDVLERCAADGQPGPETLRRITHAVLDHQHGVLQDDATMLIVEWASGHERDLTVD